MQTALDLATPDLLHMPFAENYDLLAPTVRALGRGRRPKEVALVFKLAEAFEERKTLPRTAEFAPGEIPISKRELEMAQLGALGLPFKVIAEQLGLAPDTVKKSFAIMYKKLEVNSRKELAKELTRRGLVAAPAPVSSPVRLAAIKKSKKTTLAKKGGD